MWDSPWLLAYAAVSLASWQQGMQFHQALRCCKNIPKMLPETDAQRLVDHSCHMQSGYIYCHMFRDESIISDHDNLQCLCHLPALITFKYTFYVLLVNSVFLLDICEHLLHAQHGWCIHGGASGVGLLYTTPFIALLQLAYNKDMITVYNVMSEHWTTSRKWVHASTQMSTREYKWAHKWVHVRTCMSTRECINGHKWVHASTYMSTREYTNELTNEYMRAHAWVHAST